MSVKIKLLDCVCLDYYYSERSDKTYLTVHDTNDLSQYKLALKGKLDRETLPKMFNVDGSFVGFIGRQGMVLDGQATLQDVKA